MTVPYWHCTRNTHGWSMPKRQVPTLPPTSSSPAASRRRQQHWWLHACAGEVLNGSARSAASGGLNVVPGLPLGRESAGGAGSVGPQPLRRLVRLFLDGSSKAAFPGCYSADLCPSFQRIFKDALK